MRAELRRKIKSQRHQKYHIMSQAGPVNAGQLDGGICYSKLTGGRGETILSFLSLNQAKLIVIGRKVARGEVL